MYCEKNSVFAFGFALICMLCCGCVDGGFAYHLSANLLDKSGSPAKDIPVSITCHPSKESRHSIVKTNSDGYFETGFSTGMAWGGCGLFGIPKAPIPPKPDILYLLHKDASDRWHQVELKIENEHVKKAKPGELFIHIGNIQITDS